MPWCENCGNWIDKDAGICKGCSGDLAKKRKKAQDKGVDEEGLELGFVLVGLLFLIRAFLLWNIGNIALLIPITFLYLLITYGLFTRRLYSYYLGAIILFVDMVFAFFLMFTSLLVVLNFAFNLLVLIYLITNRRRFKPKGKLDRVVLLGIGLIIALLFLYFIVDYILDKSVYPQLSTYTGEDYCGKIKDRNERENCYSQLASMTGNAEYCKELAYNPMIRCYEGIAVKFNNSNVCENLVAELGTNCFTKLAFATLNPKYCKVYFCVQTIAWSTENISVCDLLKSNDTQSIEYGEYLSCRAVLLKNIHVCDSLSEEYDLRKNCIIATARELNNEHVCDYNGSFQEACMMATAGRYGGRRIKLTVN